jgi:tetratricopeptide (TPR) repeat protein
LDKVLAARSKRAERTKGWAELVPLGALLADLGEFDEAEATYRRALREYGDVSPFAPAWVCFELGMLWGERVGIPRPDLAAQWYRTSIHYLPCYVMARVHLAEILLQQSRIEEARSFLAPAIASGNPEVCWRLAEVAEAASEGSEAASLLEAARSGFESLLTRHPLAFADHATEFYLTGGGDPARALQLARLNLANRPTVRAHELALEAARAAGDTCVSAEVVQLHGGAGREV